MGKTRLLESIGEKDQLQYLVNIKYILKVFWFPTTQV
jgi:hypothetical protein